MPDLSADEKIELDVVLKGASAFLELEREAGRLALETAQHDERLTVWIAALSAGAIVLINTITKLVGISKGQALLVLSSFILSILSALVHRWTLKELMATDIPAGYNKMASLIAVTTFSPKIRSSEGIKKAKSRLKEIMEKKDAMYIELTKKPEKWAQRANIMQYFPGAMFFLGVFLFALFATIHWDTSKGTFQVPRNQATTHVEEPN